MRVGVLALQGDFAAHGEALREAGARPIEVRTAEELESVDALVIPGGESSTLLRLLEAERLWISLLQFGRRRSIFGTCAGAILLAREVSNPEQDSLGLVDISVERNGYGRQIDSRIVPIELRGAHMEAVFIRAPIIRRAGPSCEVIATYEGNPVLLTAGLHVVATFHPELARASAATVHRMFLEHAQTATMRQ